MKHSDDPLYDRNKELLELLWAQQQMTEDWRKETFSLLSSLQAISKLNSLGKTKEIADNIRTTLNKYNYE
jgi:hypothetical protein